MVRVRARSASRIGRLPHPALRATFSRREKGCVNRDAIHSEVLLLRFCAALKGYWQSARALAVHWPNPLATMLRMTDPPF